MRLAFLLFGVVALAAGSVGAQERLDPVRAEELFAEARELMASGRDAEACPKLEESWRLDPAAGTLLNLAACYERLGRTASAWSRFLDAATMAASTDDARRERVARERANALERRLSRIAIVVPETSRAEGLEVRLGDRLVPPGDWGRALPVDPGPLAVTAAAAGRVPWTTAVDVPAQSGSLTVEVPPLSEAPPAAATSPALPPRAGVEPRAATRPVTTARPEPPARLPWAAIAAAGVGVAGVAVGTVFGLVAKNRWSEAQPHCDEANFCDEDGVALGNDARTAANVSTAAFIAGAVGLAAGAILWALAPSAAEHAPATARATPWLGIGTAGLAVSGGF